MINWEVVSNEYTAIKDGVANPDGGGDRRRISMIKEEHTLAADTRKLGELQIDLSYRIERYDSGERSDSLIEEMKDMKELISRYQGFVDGYNASGA